MDCLILNSGTKGQQPKAWTPFLHLPVEIHYNNNTTWVNTYCHSVFARSHDANHFPYITHHHKCRRLVWLLSPLHRWGNWDLGSLGNFSGFSQLERGRAGLRPRQCESRIQLLNLRALMSSWRVASIISRGWETGHSAGGTCSLISWRERTCLQLGGVGRAD